MIAEQTNYTLKLSWLSLLKHHY